MRHALEGGPGGASAQLCLTQSIGSAFRGGRRVPAQSPLVTEVPAVRAILAYLGNPFGRSNVRSLEEAHAWSWPKADSATIRLAHLSEGRSRSEAIALLDAQPEDPEAA